MNRWMKWRTSPSRIFTMLAVGFCVGVALWDVFVPLAAPVGVVFGKDVNVQGTITGEVEQLLSSQRATLDHVVMNGRPVASRVIVYFAPFPAYATDDRVSLRCALKAPQPIEGFRYDRYLSSRGVFATCRLPAVFSVTKAVVPSASGAVLRLKSFLIRRFALALPEPTAPFLSGLIFGGNTGLLPGIQDAFSATGTSHVLAASGSNVSLLTALFLGWAMETRLGRRRAIIVTAVLLAAYVVMAGAVPAIVRAALMASVLLVGAWTRREADTVNLLLVAAVVMLAMSPHILLDDPGFQLSFGATIALVTLSPAWEPAFAWIPKWGGLRMSFVASLAASTLTLPVMLWHFGDVSVIGPIANLLLLPFIPPLVFSGLAAFAGAAIHPVLGTVFGLPAWAGASLFLRAETWLGAIPFARTAMPYPHIAALLSSLPIGYLVWRSNRSSAS